MARTAEETQLIGQALGVARAMDEKEMVDRVLHDYWGERPIEMDTTPVKVEGDTTLDPIWWRGRQWAVTAHGIEALDGRYPIKAKDLRHGMDKSHSLPAQLAEKDWVDVPDFMTAWLVALALHCVPGTRAAIARAPVYSRRGA